MTQVTPATLRHLANLSRNEAREAPNAFLRNISLQAAKKWEDAALALENKPQSFAEWRDNLPKHY